MIELKGIKKLNIGGVELKKLAIDGIEVWKGYTNLVPLSTDTDGSIYNGTGYKDNTRLSSSGGVSGSALNNSATTGFMPFKQTNGVLDVIRMQNVEWKGATEKYGGHYYINCYDANKKFLSYLSDGEHERYAHIVTVTRDASGVETVKFNDSYGTSNTLLQGFRKASFIRINARGKGANMIVTINEEI